MVNQTLLRIGIPEWMLLYPSRFRELMACQEDVPASLFHRSKNGVTLPGPPQIRFVGGRKWVGILAEPGSESVIFDVMGIALRAVVRETGKIVPVSIEEHEVGVRPTHWPVRYWVHEMAIKRRTARRRQADTARLVEDVLITSLERQARRFGFSLPARKRLKLSVTIRKERELRLQTSSGLTREHIHLVDATFEMHAILEGMWFAGNLTSRGYGMIRRDPAFAVNLDMEERFQRRVVA